MKILLYLLPLLITGCMTSPKVEVKGLTASGQSTINIYVTAPATGSPEKSMSSAASIAAGQATRAGDATTETQPTAPADDAEKGEQ